MESKFFRAKKIYDNVTLIAGLGGEQSYLIEGSEKALLIDGLAGVGSLKAFVREQTDLPVTMVNTHGHVDHIGADFEYGEVYIDPADIALLYEHSNREMRLGFAKSGANTQRHQVHRLAGRQPHRQLGLELAKGHGDKVHGHVQLFQGQLVHSGTDIVHIGAHRRHHIDKVDFVRFFIGRGGLLRRAGSLFLCAGSVPRR